MKYKINEVTPKDMQCVVGACLAIYEAQGSDQESVYLIVGNVVTPSDAGLEGKVGTGEALVEVPRALIDNKRCSL
ncbi:MAG: hypothetical protein U9Q06_01035 [Nanoarchaeota archaeon]|nr:hypothetical protein [Nanoarchaeota archaeon]